ncbi:MAG TPA: VWA domain-containing protein [Gaiellaceae bacterium]|jgi:Ca-activated chloride channel family protein|nr:VWA domain-containing protein [Gaiellaceae bacterium]
MSFDQPYLLLTLLVLPLAVGLYLLAERRRMRYAVHFPNLDVLAAVAGGRAWRRFVPPALLVLALATVGVAVARPHVPALVASNRATVILVIDDSGSMQAHDVKPTRLGAAQAAVHAFLREVPKNLRVALIVFAGEPQVATPPTTDHALVDQAVDAIGQFQGFGGTAIGDALAAAVQLGVQSAGISQNQGGGVTIAYRTAAAPTPGTLGPVSILFLSDGAQTRGTLQPLEGAQKARDAHIPVYTIALGTPGGTLTRDFGGITQTIPVPPDPNTLRQIAVTTGGRFFPAETEAALHSAYTQLGTSLGRTPGRNEVTSDFVFGAAALVAAAALLSLLWSPRLP